ncbi:MAG: sigma-70 family RNA polymerase sigma factor [Planctomycetes bacterium]|nr:sigma-70 family RNA polymerase sigma factor [Planctomycetota bacterium]
MPRKYLSPCVGGLATQLKRGPVRLRLKQLANIEFLLTVVEAGKCYPYDFVCHAVTGFRPRAGDEERGSQLLDGDPLRTDLVALAEEISESANIHADRWPGAFFSAAELAARFDVSTKTIFRWRRRGLVGWKLRYPDRRTRLAFPDRCVRRFVAGNIDLVQRGSTFSQLSKEERRAIIDEARQLSEQGERTINAVARVVAARAGRAVETIRLILKHYDEAHPKAGVFNRSTLDVAANDQRLSVWEGYNDGASVKALAKRFDKPVGWIYRTITQMRAREFKARKIEFVPSEEFESATADRDILECEALTPVVAQKPVSSKRIPADLPPYLQQLFRIALLTPEGEVAIFRKLNYLKFKADRLRAPIDPETVSAAELDRVEDLLEQAGRVKNQITQSNLRLVVSIAKRHANRGQDFFEIISDGNLALMRAVEKFDYMRGYKFSTYASWAVIRNYARSIPDDRTHRDRYQTGKDEMLQTVAGFSMDEPEDDFLPVARATLDRMLGTLDDRERNILRQRFGLDDECNQSQTLAQIGVTFGVSKERIRQLEARAMTKLRGDFADEAVALYGS